MQEETLDEDGNIIYDDETIDDVDISKLNIPRMPDKPGVIRYVPKSLIRSATSSECAHRKAFRCDKLDKSISIDGRDVKHPKCWERMFCNDYQKKVK